MFDKMNKFILVISIILLLIALFGIGVMIYAYARYGNYTITEVPAWVFWLLA